MSHESNRDEVSDVARRLACKENWNRGEPIRSDWLGRHGDVSEDESATPRRLRQAVPKHTLWVDGFGISERRIRRRQHKFQAGGRGGFGPPSLLRSMARHPLSCTYRAAAPSVSKAGGGEEGIRTLDTTFAVWRFSKALPSATRPPLRCRSYALNRPAGSNRKVRAIRSTGASIRLKIAGRRDPNPRLSFTNFHGSLIL